MNTKQRKQRSTQNLVRLLARSKLEVSAVLVVRKLGGGNLSPEIGGKESVCFGNLLADIISISNQRQYKVLRTATKVAFKKLPMVAVEPLDCV